MPIPSKQQRLCAQKHAKSWLNQVTPLGDIRHCKGPNVGWKAGNPQAMTSAAIWHWGRIGACTTMQWQIKDLRKNV